MLKYLLCLVFYLVTLVAQGQAVYTVDNVPDPKRFGNGYVSDPDGYLSPGAIDSLNQLIAAVEGSSSAQIAVVVVESIGEANPKDFAVALFEKWAIGQAGKDNGLLIFTAMDQRRTEFETGYGVEGILPDVLCYRIAMQYMVPHFQAANYGTGLISVVQQIKTIFEDPTAIEELQTEQYRLGHIDV